MRITVSNHAGERLEQRLRVFGEVQKQKLAEAAWVHGARIHEAPSNDIRVWMQRRRKAPSHAVRYQHGMCWVFGETSDGGRHLITVVPYERRRKR